MSIFERCCSLETAKVSCEVAPCILQAVGYSVMATRRACCFQARHVVCGFPGKPSFIHCFANIYAGLQNALDGAGGGKGVKDGKGRKQKKAGDEEDEEEETYYDAMKKDMGDRAARTKVGKLCVTPSQLRGAALLPSEWTQFFCSLALDDFADAFIATGVAHALLASLPALFVWSSSIGGIFTGHL